MNVLVLQHIACEPPGVFEDVLLERGAADPPGRARRGRAATRLARIRRDRRDGWANVRDGRRNAPVADRREAAHRRGRSRRHAVLGRLPRRAAARVEPRRPGLRGRGARGRRPAGRDHSRRTRRPRLRATSPTSSSRCNGTATPSTCPPVPFASPDRPRTGTRRSGTRTRTASSSTSRSPTRWPGSGRACRRMRTRSTACSGPTRRDLRRSDRGALGRDAGARPSALRTLAGASRRLDLPPRDARLVPELARAKRSLLQFDRPLLRRSPSRPHIVAIVRSDSSLAVRRGSAWIAIASSSAPTTSSGTNGLSTYDEAPASTASSARPRERPVNATMGTTRSDEDLTRRLDASDSRQAEVEQNCVGLVLTRELDRLGAVAGSGDFEPRVFEDEAQVCAHDRVVFDRQNGGYSSSGHGFSFAQECKRPRTRCRGLEAIPTTFVGDQTLPMVPTRPEGTSVQSRSAQEFLRRKIPASRGCRAGPDPGA